jgi:hypothetical protein
MNNGVFIASAAALVIAVSSGSSALATTSSLDPIFVPAVHADETFRYSEVDRLTGAIRHTHTNTTMYRVISNQNGVLSYEREIAGKGKTEFQRDSLGNVNSGQGAKSGVPFFVPRQFLGDAPNPVAVGQSWQVRMPVETSLGFPGTATVSVASIDPAAKHIVLRVSMRGEGDVSDMTPADNTPTRFHTVTNRRATLEISNGIVDSYAVVGDDKQSANQSDPINVHIELTMKRIK